MSKSPSVTSNDPAAFDLLMRIGLLAALLLVTAGCGAYAFPGESPSPSPPPATGTVSGRVIAISCSPVEQQGNACAGRPVPSLELDYVGGAAVVTKAVTDSNGNYSVQLKPGTYVVKMRTYMRVLSGPLNLTIAAGSVTTANYVLDSGIRAPVPQQ
jgi:hypothetical protein